MAGWIKIHRTITDNWVWQNSDYLKWWIDILIEVNHTPSKTLIKGSLYECSRGQKLYSLDTWAKRWGTNKSKARRFLKMLEKDNMIVFKSETQTTRITVCKYDSYQSLENESETQVKRKRNANETAVKPIQECKEEIKNEKYLYTQTDFIQRWKDARLFYDKQPTNISKLLPFEIIDFNNIIKTYSKKQIDEAISGLFFQNTYKDTRLRPSHFLRLENFEKYLTCWQTKEKLYTDNIKKVERL